MKPRVRQKRRNIELTDRDWDNVFSAIGTATGEYDSFEIRRINAVRNKMYRQLRATGFRHSWEPKPRKTAKRR